MEQNQKNQTDNKNLFTIEDVYESQDKNEPIDLTKQYDPLYFWDNCGDKFFKSYKKSQDLNKYIGWLVSRIKSLKVDTLLDAGCGFARIAPFLIDSEAVKEINAIDISQKQLDSAKDYLKNYSKADKIKLEKRSLKWSNVAPYTYDCTMSVECMQHLPLTSVRYAIRQLQKVSKKYVVIVERFLYDGEHPLPHLWSHNYIKLATDIGLKVLEAKFIDAGVIAIVFKK